VKGWSSHLILTSYVESVLVYWPASVISTCYLYWQKDLERAKRVRRKEERAPKAAEKENKHPAESTPMKMGDYV